MQQRERREDDRAHKRLISWPNFSIANSVCVAMRGGFDGRLLRQTHFPSSQTRVAAVARGASAARRRTPMADNRAAREFNSLRLRQLDLINCPVAARKVVGGRSSSNSCAVERSVTAKNHSAHGVAAITRAAPEPVEDGWSPLRLSRWGRRQFERNPTLERVIEISPGAIKRAVAVHQ